MKKGLRHVLCAMLVVAGAVQAAESPSDPMYLQSQLKALTEWRDSDGGWQLSVADREKFDRAIAELQSIVDAPTATTALTAEQTEAFTIRQTELRALMRAAGPGKTVCVKTPKPGSDVPVMRCGNEVLEPEAPATAPTSGG